MHSFSASINQFYDEQSCVLGFFSESVVEFFFRILLAKQKGLITFQILENHLKIFDKKFINFLLPHI